MKYKRQRVDWDEEIRKTERIRRRGFFISALGFGVALVFILGTNRLNVLDVEIGRKIIFALCLVLSMFILRLALRRRERLKREQKEKEEAQIIERMRLNSQKTEEE